jgi:hypothetical protein
MTDQEIDQLLHLATNADSWSPAPWRLAAEGLLDKNRRQVPPGNYSEALTVLQFWAQAHPKAVIFLIQENQRLRKSMVEAIEHLSKVGEGYYTNGSQAKAAKDELFASLNCF